MFTNKPKPPLELAIRRVGEAVDMASRYLCDRRYMPTEDELKQFERLEKVLWHNHMLAQYIARNLYQRFHGKPEGSAKFTNPKTFDYHYPK